MPKIDRKFRVARIWSNKELKKFSHLFKGDVINVSAGENIDKQGLTYDTYFPNASGFYTSNFSPGSFRGFQGKKNELLIDLNKELPKEYQNQFDVAFAHTVLEHVYDVNLAFSNICLLSKDIVIVVVPFSQVQHDSEDYKDYWRFSPASLRRLFLENQFKVIYEACNNDFNSAIYLFFIGSRQPDEWKGIISPYKPISVAGKGIGYQGMFEAKILNIFYLIQKFINKE